MFIVGAVGFTAVHAYAAHQALCDHANNVSRHDVRQHTQILQARNGADGGIGMQRGIHLMAGHRGAECHFCRFLIANLTDQNDIRILPHHGANATGEIEFGDFIDRRLANHRHRIFDRIFQRHDIDGFGVDVIQDRIKRRGFTRAGGTGHENDAFGPRHHEAQHLQFIFTQTQIFQWHDAFLPVKNTQHNVFAVRGGLCGYPKVNRTAGQAERNSPILRRACFRDVHAADDFQAHHHCRPVIFVQRTNLPEYAVDAIANAQESLFRLEVNIGRAALDGIVQ